MIKIDVKDQTPELFQKVEKAISRFVRKSALYIEGEVKSSMAEPKSGTETKRGNNSHIASAPGESPAVDSSNYIGSIQSIFTNSLEAKIGTPIEYAQYLEDGTENIEQRPLWEKTQTDALPTLEALLANELRAI